MHIARRRAAGTSPPSYKGQPTVVQAYLSDAGLKGAAKATKSHESCAIAGMIEQADPEDADCPGLPARQVKLLQFFQGFKSARDEHPRWSRDMNTVNDEHSLTPSGNTAYPSSQWKRSAQIRDELNPRKEPKVRVHDEQGAEQPRS